ncbi:unnamed protein product [Parajaminaea phylloscopi]
MPGIHRCSAVGLEEVLNEAWATLETDEDRTQAEAAYLGITQGELSALNAATTPGTAASGPTQKRDGGNTASGGRSNRSAQPSSGSRSPGQPVESASAYASSPSSSIPSSSSSSHPTSLQDSDIRRKAPQGAPGQQQQTLRPDAHAASRKYPPTSPNRSRPSSPSIAATSGKSSPDPQQRHWTLGPFEAAPILSFLSALQLRTIVYLSPSLLPCALLKLAHQLDLNLVQWNLVGPKIWRARSSTATKSKAAGAAGRDAELRALETFASARAAARRQRRRSKTQHDARHCDTSDTEAMAFTNGAGGGELTPSSDAETAFDGEKEDDDDDDGDGDEQEDFAREDDEEDELQGLDHIAMCRATIELALNRHCNGVLICDSSGLSETSLVVGCLRRMLRRSFASICLEYRAFAPQSQRSASSTTNHLRFIETFPLETLRLPAWEDLVPWAVEGLMIGTRRLQGHEE